MSIKGFGKIVGTYGKVAEWPKFAMKNTKTYTREQVLEELLESDECVHVESDTSWRHGSYETYVAKDPEDGFYYMFTLMHHTHEGFVDVDEVEAHRVEPVQVMTTEWREVK